MCKTIWIIATLAVFGVGASHGQQGARSSGAPAAATPTPSAPSCETIHAEQKEDRFTGNLTVKTTPIVEADKFHPLFIWLSENPDILYFEIAGSADTWRYLTCHPVAMLANGNRIALGGVEHQGQVNDGGFVAEIVITSVPWSETEKLMTATQLEFKVCNDEFQTPLEILCQVKDVIRIAKEWKKAAIRLKKK
ncbi:MAG: hypothetical protein WAM82_23205 [Thermoanaerobaculia bacterium]